MMVKAGHEGELVAPQCQVRHERGRHAVWYRSSCYGSPQPILTAENDKSQKRFSQKSYKNLLIKKHRKEDRNV